MQIEAQWIVGFVDGEGCFHISIPKNDKMAFGYQILPEFTIVQHERDVKVLYALKTYFGCGTVRVNRQDTRSLRMAYRVRKHEHLIKIICPFFMRHTLKTQKNVDFRKFRRVCLLMHDKKHLTQEGFDTIRAIAVSMRRMRTDNTPI